MKDLVKQLEEYADQRFGHVSKSRMRKCKMGLHEYSQPKKTKTANGHFKLSDQVCIYCESKLKKSN